MKKILLVFLLVLFGCVGISEQIVKRPPPVSNEQKLINQISSKNDAIATRAIDTLGRQDKASPAVVKKYEDMFRNYKNNDRIESLLDAIYLYDNQGAFLPGLEICLTRTNEDIRYEAIDIISDIEKKPAVGVLIRALANKYPDVREEAQDALEFITDKEFKSQERWIQWWNNNKKTFKF